jgi:proline racemase
MRLTNLVTVIGCHAAGEIGNVVVGGIGDVPGTTMFDKLRYLETERDDLRQRLLHEPRGAVVRTTNVVLPSNHPAAAFGYVIMESTEYPAMSGSNTICVATVLLESGMVPMVEPVTTLTLESPAGLITLTCECRDGKVLSVRFVNQPAFVYELDAELQVPGLGTLTVDVAWGGMAYVLVDATAAGFTLAPGEARELCVAGQRIKRAAVEQLAAVHPEHPEYPGITQLEFTLPLRREDGVLRAKNAVVVNPGRLDRSPCGTGTSARLAVLQARGEIEVGEGFVAESIIDTEFHGRVEQVTTVGGRAAIVPSVAGQAWITDISQVGLDPSDPFPTGFRLSDTWMNAP